MQVYEEVKSHPKVVCDVIEEHVTFQQAQLQHGDILLVQQALTEVMFLQRLLACLHHQLLYLHACKDGCLTAWYAAGLYLCKWWQSLQLWRLTCHKFFVCCINAPLFGVLWVLSQSTFGTYAYCVCSNLPCTMGEWYCYRKKQRSWSIQMWRASWSTWAKGVQQSLYEASKCACVKPAWPCEAL